MELSELKGLGPTRLEKLRAMGIRTLRDFLYMLPVTYEDRTHPVPIAQAHAGMRVLLEGIVATEPRLNRFNGLTRVTFSLRDESGAITAVWFNAPWMTRSFKLNDLTALYGYISEKNNKKQIVNASVAAERDLQPVYRAIKGFPAKTLRELMRTALTQLDDCCPETLPRTIRLEHDLCELNFALTQAHFPASTEHLKLARRRIAFEQMLLYQAAIGLQGSRKQPGFAMTFPEAAANDYWQSLPFPPTAAQRRVLEKIAADLRRDTAMSRLVQGDVGCGKTAVAFGAMTLAVQAGYQAVMMAPTEILAAQHFETAKSMLAPLGIRCGLLTGSMKVSEKKKAHAAIAAGDWDVAFGTHALISEGVAYHRLGLVITDEQHRFGVRQRSALGEKGNDGERSPHVLVMSATPIPRTLALILYGDLELSVIDELPPGRTPVRTRIVPDKKRGDMFRFLREEVAAGRQAYVICPLVEDSEMLEDVRSVKTTYDELCAGELAGLRVGLTWGEQPPLEKAETLRAFAAGETDVLVSTTVVEVGVNVPNASVMVIENAERFGLSQLHQLRGRVGRGSAVSWCFLLAGASERLRILTETNDGFLVAQKDLEQRGPGDLMGTRQAGEAFAGFLPDGDVRLLEETAACLKALRSDPARAQELAQIEAAARQAYETMHVALN